MLLQRCDQGFLYLYKIHNMIVVILRSTLVEDQEAQTSPALPVFFLPFVLQFPPSLLLYTQLLPQVLLNMNQLLTNITHTWKAKIIFSVCQSRDFLICVYIFYIYLRECQCFWSTGVSITILGLVS